MKVISRSNYKNLLPVNWNCFCDLCIAQNFDGDEFSLPIVSLISGGST